MLKLTKKALKYAEMYYWSKGHVIVQTSMVEIHFYGCMHCDIYPSQKAKKDSIRNFLFKWDDKCLALLTDKELKEIIIALHKAIVRK